MEYCEAGLRSPEAKRFFLENHTKPMLVIEAGKVGYQYWKDLWSYRELFYFLAWRDVLVRYKQTVIGVMWAVLRPLLTMIVFTVVFGKLAKMPSQGVPYPILVFAGMLPWQFFSTALSESSSSLISNSNLLTKVYFPRLIIPTSSVIASFVDFSISFVLMFLLMIAYGVWPTWRFVFFPVFCLHALAVSIGSGLWLAALNVKYRDFRYVVPFIVQLGCYISPVGFDSGVVPEQWRLLYSCNPMVGVIDGFRWFLLGQENFYWPGFLCSTILTLLLLWTGISYFRRTEGKIADII